MIQHLLTGALQVDRLTVPIANLPSHLAGLKVVQLSDFHYDGGLMLTDDLLQQAIAATNRVQPDLIFLTGDFISHQPEPIHRLAQQLQSLRSRYGVFAVLGNHDLIYPHSRAIITAALTQADIPVLWNQVVYPCGDGLAIVGLPDYWSKDFQPSAVFPTISEATPRLVLSHNPDSAASLKSWRVDLQFSGHTHGGQIIIPGIGNLSAIVAQRYEDIPRWIREKFPLLRSTRRVVDNWEWVSGLHAVDRAAANPTYGPTHIDRNQLYVNRGLGTYPPGRLYCPPEVTVITLVSAADRQSADCPND